jgi:hypothetical protein
MGRPNKKSRLIASHRTATGTFGCTGEKEPADDERSLQYGSDDESDMTRNSTNHDANLDRLLEEMGEKEFSAMVKSNKEAAYPNWYARAKGYDGGSRTSIWRKNKNRQLALKEVPMRGIDIYFTKATTTAHHQEAADAAEAPFLAGGMRVEEGTPPSPKTTKRIRRASSQIAEDIAAGAAAAAAVREHMMWCYGLIEEIVAKNSNFCRRILVQYITIQKCLACQIDGMRKVESAKIAAAGLPKGSGYCSSIKCILNWTKVFLETEMLPVSEQGKHRKRASLLNDEDVSSRIREWLLLTSKVYRTPDKLCRWINESLLVEITGYVGHNVSERTVRRWMNTVGYKYGIWKKGIFIDGHERADVVEYRKEFLFRMLSRFKFMQWWEGDDMQTALGQECASKTEIVWVSHDESIFYSNDDGGKGWGSEDHPDIHKKGNGRSIMVSDFICPCHGRLRLNGVPISAQIEPGKNHDGYWQATDILKQLEEKAIPAFDQMHPEARGLFVFDNSTNHGAYAADALVAVASKMNLGPGGKVPVMRSTSFFNELGVEIEQAMHEHNVPKGLKKILLEREMWIEKLPKHCGAKFAVGSNPECCAIHRLGAQPDFRAQKSILYEAIGKTRHICDFLPKFHCELAPIENFWGYAKKHTRSNCDYSIVALRKVVPLSLDAVPLPSIRKYFRRATHLMQAYSKGCTYKLAEYAHKKYKSHRRILDHQLDQILLEIAR